MTSSDRPFTDGAETEDVAPELNPELDRAEIADVFRRTGRVHIPDILTRRFCTTVVPHVGARNALGPHFQ